jgi:hypothetical protein
VGAAAEVSMNDVPDILADSDYGGHILRVKQELMDEEEPMLREESRGPEEVADRTSTRLSMLRSNPNGYGAMNPLHTILLSLQLPIYQQTHLCHGLLLHHQCRILFQLKYLSTNHLLLSIQPPP